MNDSAKPNPTKPVLSQRQRQLAASRKRRREKTKVQEALLEGLALGLDRVTLAAQLGVSVKTVSREIDRALDNRQPMNTTRFVRLQTERLQRALGAIDNAMKEGQTGAVGALLAVLDKLDRYHGLHLQAANMTAPPAPAAPLALTRERTEILTQPLEIAAAGTVLGAAGGEPGAKAEA